LDLSRIIGLAARALALGVVFGVLFAAALVFHASNVESAQQLRIARAHNRTIDHMIDPLRM
jgi:hypothetical protein